MLTSWSPALLSLVAGAILGSAVASPIARSQAQQGAGSAQTLACRPGDVVLDVIVEVGIDQQGGDEHPEDALRHFLTSEEQARNMNANNFHRTEQRNAEVEFAFEQEGVRRAAAVTQEIGDSWYVTYFAACGDALRA